MRITWVFLITVIGIWSGSVGANFEAYLRAYNNKDYAKAFAACKDDALKGDSECQEALGFMYGTGAGVKRDDAEAVKWHRLAANQGNALAQYNLGFSYQNGLSVKQDYAEAIKWYRLAADQGNALAQNGIGIMYRGGLGVKQDYAEAVKWFRLAANQGEVFAQSNLGDMYIYGWGVKQDYAEALKWYQEAVKQSNAGAQNGLGWMYQYGLGVEKNYEEAVKWYRLAADQGNQYGQANLGFMYGSGLGVLKDHTEAIKWFRLAADQGNSVAQNSIAAQYRNGWGVKQDTAEELRWRRLSANQGNGLAQAALGLSYQNGEGVKVDETEALKWFTLSEKSTFGLTEEQRPLVRKNRLDLEARLSSTDIRTAQQRAENWKPEQPTTTQQVAVTPQTVAESKGEPQNEKQQKTRVDNEEQKNPPNLTAATTVKSGNLSSQNAGTLTAFALVVGNSAYPNAKLPNAGNDARAIAKQLTSFGIKVDLVIDASRKKFVEALSKFADKSVGADLILVYYAGHGVQYNGVNYLIPVDLDLTGDATTTAFTLEALSLNHLLEQYLPGKTRLVFLDACRDNPLSRSLVRTRGAGAAPGLAPISVGSGTLISYATKDGNVAQDGAGQHSPYTEALLVHLGDRADINIVLRRVRSQVLQATSNKQEPWEYGSLVGDEIILSTMIKK